MDTPSPRETNIRRPHPLAVALIERLRLQPGVRVVEIGAGRGRNTAALRAAGLSVYAIADDAVIEFAAGERFGAALSTHALLHGTPRSVAETISAIAKALGLGAPLYATFASKNDARYGKGTRVEDDAFAPDDGDETGVVHAYFDETSLRRMLQKHFILERLEERPVDDIVGSWAHERRPQGSVHWFVHARAPETVQ